jgi:hypothetical protein
VFDYDGPIGDGECKLVIKQVMAFKLGVNYVGAGLSFRQACACLKGTSERTGLKRISGLRKQDVCRFVRAVVGITPQNMSDLVRSNECWSFSIAFDGATAQDRSLLNVRLRQLVAVASRTCTFWLYRCGSLTPAWAWPSSFIRL